MPQTLRGVQCSTSATGRGSSEIAVLPAQRRMSSSSNEVVSSCITIHNTIPYQYSALGQGVRMTNR